MRLIEILATVLSEWPEGTEYAAQDSCDEWKGRVWFTDNEFSDCVNGSWDIGDGNIENHINGLELSSDCNTSIVTRSQWARKRVKQRQLIREGYRIISQPQAEEVEVNVFVGKDVKIEYAYAQEGVEPEHLEWKTMGTAKIDSICDLGSTEAKTDQIDGPIKWRDEVTELNAYIEKFTRERDELIERLASEGFALIAPVVSVMSEFDCVDASDWRSGDIISCTLDYNGQFTKGAEYIIERISKSTDRVNVVSDDKGVPNGWGSEYFKFIRRP